MADLSERSPVDQLAALQLAWMVAAATARNAQLYVPGGFAAEKARQALVLEHMAIEVSSAEPDLECERLLLEDLEGAEHVRRGDGAEGRPPRPTD